MYTFIAEEQADPACEWSLAEMCRTLEVSRSGFYDWQTRGPSARQLEDRVLAREIELIHIASDETYGVPRMTQWLRRQGFEVNHKRVARIMGELGLEGESGRRRVRTTVVDKRAVAADDRVRRDFNPPAPDVTWCGEELPWVRLANEPDRLVEAVMAHGAAPDVAIEATYGWYWAVDALQAAGASVHLVAPARVAAFEGRRVKNDLSDCRLLVDLLRAGILPEAWIAPPDCRHARELVRHRAKLVALRSGLKSQIHAVLAKCGVPINHAHLFDTDSGLSLLDHLVRTRLDGAFAERVQSLCTLIDQPSEQIDHTAQSSTTT